MDWPVEPRLQVAARRVEQPGRCPSQRFAARFLVRGRLVLRPNPIDADLCASRLPALQIHATDVGAIQSNLLVVRAKIIAQRRELMDTSLRQTRRSRTLAGAGPKGAAIAIALLVLGLGGVANATGNGNPPPANCIDETVTPSFEE